MNSVEFLYKKSHFCVVKAYELNEIFFYKKKHLKSLWIE